MTPPRANCASMDAATDAREGPLTVFIPSPYSPRDGLNGWFAPPLLSELSEDCSYVGPRLIFFPVPDMFSGIRWSL